MSKSLLVLGANGNLGKAIIKSFKKDWRVAGIDVMKGSNADLNLAIDIERHPND